MDLDLPPYSAILSRLFYQGKETLFPVFDVDSPESLHRLLIEWADVIPAEFGIYPLMGPESIKAFLSEDSGDRPRVSDIRRCAHPGAIWLPEDHPWSDLGA